MEVFPLLFPFQHLMPLLLLCITSLLFAQLSVHPVWKRREEEERKGRKGMPAGLNKERKKPKVQRKV